MRYSHSLKRKRLGCGGITMLLFGYLAGSGCLCAQESAVTDPKPSTTLSPAPDSGGYVLITPLQSQETVLIGPDGKEHHVWKSQHHATAGARMQPDGSILRIAKEKPAKTFLNLGVSGGRVQHLGWNGEVLWDFWNATTYYMVCGDALFLPNGNVLMCVVEYKSHADAIKLGRDADLVKETGLYAPGLMEFKPEGKDGARLIWRWSAWDHLVQNRDPAKPNHDKVVDIARSRRLNINEGISGRGLMCTELAYDKARDVILMTLPGIGEIWLLDHSTSTAEAGMSKGGEQGFGGDLLWRWAADTVTGPQAKQLTSANLIANLNAEMQPGFNLHVLSRQFISDQLLEFSIESFSPRWSSDVKEPSNEITDRLIEKRWNENFNMSMMQHPDSITNTTDKNWLITNRVTGSFARVDQTGNTIQQYANVRGQKEYRIPKRAADGYCCTPQEKAEKQTASLNKSPDQYFMMKGAFIGKPRYYQRAFLESELHSAE